MVYFPPSKMAFSGQFHGSAACSQTICRQIVEKLDSPFFMVLAPFGCTARRFQIIRESGYQGARFRITGYQ
jgi:hypothetical protein